VSEDRRFTDPLYTVAQASRLVGMPASTLATWAKGYTRRFDDRADVKQGPIITALEADHPGAATIPFVGLVEAMVVQAFRRTDLPLQRIRRALDVLMAQGALDHALASQRLYSDGADVLYDYAREVDDGQLRLLTVVSSGQRVFHEVIDSYLKRIHFDGDRWATEVIVPVTAREILRIRPDTASGDPLFVSSGAPLSVVTSRLRAGEPIASVAADFAMPIDEIREAVDAISPSALAA
jgi:uncharacterized protein (DUF433 family)